MQISDKCILLFDDSVMSDLPSWFQKKIFGAGRCDKCALSYRISHDFIITTLAMQHAGTAS